MRIQWNGTSLTSSRIDHILSTIHGEKRFSLWSQDTLRFKPQLDSLFERAGLPGQLWASFVADYAGWIEEGKKLADFVVVYGFPPNLDDRQLFLLSLCTPYAMQLRGMSVPALSSDGAVIDQLRGMMR